MRESERKRERKSMVHWQYNLFYYITNLGNGRGANGYNPGTTQKGQTWNKKLTNKLIKITKKNQIMKLMVICNSGFIGTVIKDRAVKKTTDLKLKTVFVLIEVA